MHGAAKDHLVARQRRRIDDDGARQLVFELDDFRLDLALALLGRMIFGVFGQITMRARNLDLLDDFRPLNFLQTLQRRREDRVTFRQNRKPFNRRHYFKLLPLNCPKTPSFT